MFRRGSIKFLFFLSSFSLLIIILIFAFSYLLKDNLEFYIQTDQVKKISDQNKVFRLGGIIQPGSIKIMNDLKKIEFIILDESYKNPIKIIYYGLSTPPIFKENSGIIARGKLDIDFVFHSNELIGKHDENYVPKK